jgi:hypothetical protein
MYGSAIDMGFLPPQFRGDVQLFFPTGNANTLWQTWNKPRGISMIYMIAIAGGGGGGGGFTRATTVAGGGGGSGACSGMATLMMPAIFLPDTLKVSVGPGGAGGAPGANGQNGVNSYVTLGAGLTTGITIPNVILASGANAPGGGGAGTGAAAGPAGAVPTVATIGAVGPMGKLGIWPNTGTATNNGYVGLVGVIGGAQTGAAGTNITTGWNVIPFTPGASGAGVNTAGTGFVGGSITLQAAVDFADGAFSPAAILAGGTAGSGAAVGGNGNNGIRSMKPFLHTGGTGGGSADGQIGGNGGMGGIGCGGGGGGAGTTGGRGGNGGDGMVAIICW